MAGYDAPLAILAATICTYWSTVLLLVAYKRLRFGQSAGLWPRKAKERRLWLLVAPVVGCWVALPLVALLLPSGWLEVPTWARGTPGLAVRGAAAGLAVGFYYLSLKCWLEMGQSWSMAIVPGQKTSLVTSGIYSWVRHPIYALSIGLMLCTLVVLPTLPILALAAIHFIAFNRKAAYEEQHLTMAFGSEYESYCRRVGRFWPGRSGGMARGNQVLAK